MAPPSGRLTLEYEIRYQKTFFQIKDFQNQLGRGGENSVVRCKKNERGKKFHAVMGFGEHHCGGHILSKTFYFFWGGDFGEILTQFSDSFTSFTCIIFTNKLLMYDSYIFYLMILRLLQIGGQQILTADKRLF